jgi:hypothetical protein
VRVLCGCVYCVLCVRACVCVCVRAVAFVRMQCAAQRRLQPSVCALATGRQRPSAPCAGAVCVAKVARGSRACSSHEVRSRHGLRMYLRSGSAYATAAYRLPRATPSASCWRSRSRVTRRRAEAIGSRRSRAPAQCCAELYCVAPGGAALRRCWYCNSGGVLAQRRQAVLAAQPRISRRQSHAHSHVARGRPTDPDLQTLALLRTPKALQYTSTDVISVVASAARCCNTRRTLQRSSTSCGR